MIKVKVNKKMKRIEGAIKGQNDHIVPGVVIALHISMLKSCIYLKGTYQPESSRTDREEAVNQGK